MCDEEMSFFYVTQQLKVLEICLAVDEEPMDILCVRIRQRYHYGGCLQ